MIGKACLSFLTFVSLLISNLYAQKMPYRVFLNNPIRVYRIQLEKTTETDLTANHVHERLHEGLLETASHFQIVYEENRPDLPTQLHITQCYAYESDLINKGTEPINARESYQVYEKIVKLTVTVEFKIKNKNGKEKKWKKKFQKSGKIITKMFKSKGNMQKEVISEWTWEKAPYQMGEEINRWIASILDKQK